MAYRSITQIILILIAVVVIFTYIQPKMAEIDVIQNEVAQYEEAVNKATEFNQLLSTLLSRSAGFSQNEIKSLERYLPSEQDMVSVARDLSIVANQANVSIGSISLEDSQAGSKSNNRMSDDFEEDDAGLLIQSITVSIVGSYANAKDFVSLIENNAYPLNLTSLTLDSEGGGSLEDTEEVYSFTLVYETYSLPAKI